MQLQTIEQSISCAVHERMLGSEAKMKSVQKQFDNNADAVEGVGKKANKQQQQK